MGNDFVARDVCNHRYVCRKIGRLDEAIESYSLALKHGGPSTKLLANRAYCLAKIGHFEEAIEDYNSILAADPCNAHALHNRQAAKPCSFSIAIESVVV
jgi:tetratricopeptide (TPR) repeat protein